MKLTLDLNFYNASRRCRVFVNWKYFFKQFFSAEKNKITELHAAKASWQFFLWPKVSFSPLLHLPDVYMLKSKVHKAINGCNNCVLLPKLSVICISGKSRTQYRSMVWHGLKRQSLFRIQVQNQKKKRRKNRNAAFNEMSCMIRLRKEANK